MASPSVVMEQPNMESDSADASNVEPQEIVDSSSEDSPTESVLLLVEFAHTEAQTYLRELRNSSNQIPKELTTLGDLFDHDTVVVLGNAKRRRNDIMVYSWLKGMKEVLLDINSILTEIKNANIFGQSAEEQSGANKPWKLILNLVNKISSSPFLQPVLWDSAHSVFSVERAPKRKADFASLLHILFSSTAGCKKPRAGFGVVWSVLELMYQDIRICLWKLRNSSNQTPKELTTLRSLLENTIHVAEDAERYRNDIMVKIWIAEMKSVLYDTASILFEIKNANIFEQTAEVQSSANKPWKLILNLFNKISRFMHYYRGKRMVSELKDITARLEEILGKGKQLLKEIPDERTQSDLQYRLTTPDPNERFANAVRNAISKGKYYEVQDLIGSKPDAISITFENGQTALHIAITAGQVRVAEELIVWTNSANSHHLGIKDKNGNTALSYAARSGMMEIAKRLIGKNKNLLTIPGGGNMLPVQLACRAGHEDMTRYLYRNTPQECLKGGYGFYLLEECITRKMLGTRLKVNKGSVLSDGVGSVAAQRRALDENEFVQSGAVEATFEAIKNGIPEIAIEIAKVNTNILWNCTDSEDSRNMFACAVVHRQEEVAQFLYEFNARIGAAFQLQSELRWFKAVEGIVPQFYNYHKNKRGETPSEVFVKEHGQLVKEAEEWLNKTAESSTVVGALIITITFAVAFTVPGGNDQKTGFPIFLNKTADSSTVPSPTMPFMLFVVSDAISLFAASSWVLMFLGIVRSRFAVEDFLKSLPVKLIIGISSLFISVAAMMVAFYVALFIMLQGRLWIIIPVTLLAGIPFIMFVPLLFPLLVELYTSTFRLGIFDSKKNINIGKGREK
ncbi:hypothetical protein SLEP1_g53093 [Rubroshorea leprosula]|uniref:PGG domain-containing protein n=1 Tax=Rubroshorea leprosula TaxID=152421 RepID=A0AAV5M8G5_9ROSI|nr:hypothetical protein SLEP1_g53093 [Rubroshorea leprosula]